MRHPTPPDIQYGTYCICNIQKNVYFPFKDRCGSVPGRLLSSVEKRQKRWKARSSWFERTILLLTLAGLLILSLFLFFLRRRVEERERTHNHHKTHQGRKAHALLTLTSIITTLSPACDDLTTKKDRYVLILVEAFSSIHLFHSLIHSFIHTSWRRLRPSSS